MNFNQFNCQMLNVRKREIDDQSLHYSNLNLLDDERFRIDFSSESLKTNELIVPVLGELDFLIPSQIYVKNLFNREVLLDSYSKFVDYEIEYAVCHLLKMKHSFGYKSLKSSDHRFLEKTITAECTYFFQYNFDERRWFNQKDENVWIQEREKVEEIIMSEEAMSILKMYIKNLDIVSEKNFLSEKDTFKDSLLLAKDIYNSTEKFIVYQNSINKIDDYYFSILNFDLSRMKEIIEKFSDKIFANAFENDFIDLLHKMFNELKNLEYSIESLLHRERGYYVYNDQLFANIAEMNRLSQRAKYFRNVSQLENIRSEILKLAYLRNVEYVSISDPVLKIK